MSGRSFRHRGHRINVYPSTLAVAYDDGVALRDDERACTACDRTATGRLDPDPCLGFLPGVTAACCGHGLVHSAYVARDGRQVAVGHAAVEVLRSLGATVPDLGDDDDEPIGEQLLLRSLVWMRELVQASEELGGVTAYARDVMATIGAAL